jgi:hypothetical protein
MKLVRAQGVNAHDQEGRLAGYGFELACSLQGVEVRLHGGPAVTGSP